MKYYSEKLNKLFDTEKDLKAAEKELTDKEAKKAEAASQKKADANKVEEAFKARNAARREYNTKVMDARKAYNSALLEAKKAFDAIITEATASLDKAEVEYNTALKEFTNKHPEGYHMTLKDGDNVMTLSKSGEKQIEKTKEYVDSVMDVFKAFFNI